MRPLSFSRRLHILLWNKPLWKENGDERIEITFI